MDIQAALFEKLRPLIPKGKTLAEYLGNLLYLSNDSIYRRLRGETQLNLQELQSICLHFGLSADTLINLRKDGQITFDVSRMGTSSTSFFDFVKRLYEDITFLKNTGNSYIIYSGKDVPFMYNLLFPRLFAFKHYIWMQVFAQSPEFNEKVFDPNINDPELILTANKIVELYCDIPSTEIWNEENINALLIQIDFYRNSRLFSSTEQINAIYDEIDELLVHLRRQAEAGTKFLPGENVELRKGNYKLFLNQIILSENVILVKAGDRPRAYINYSVINHLSTKDHEFCSEVESYLNNIIRRSTQISLENIKMRTIFFNNQHEKVAWYRKKLHG